MREKECGKKKKNNNKVGGVLACRLLFRVVVGRILLPTAGDGVVLDWWWRLKRPCFADNPVFRHSRISAVTAGFGKFRLAVLMSILGEVRITGLRCLQQFTQDQGFTDVVDVECRLSGNAEGKVHIRASLHIRTATFGNEEWKLNFIDVQPLCQIRGPSLPLVVAPWVN